MERSSLLCCFLLIFSLAALRRVLCLSPPETACPCIQMADGTCFAYDSRFMAASLEEALVSFPDLSLLDPPDPVDIKPTHAHESYCDSEECRICQEDIRQRVTEIGLATFPGSNSTTETTNITCSRYSFTRHHGGMGAEEEHSCEEEHGPEHGSEHGSDSGSDDSGECDCQMHKSNMQDRMQHHTKTKRSRRQTDPAVLGTRYGISCTKKGAETTTSGEAVSLCTSCWVWRQLPENYFPRFINELVCDDADNVCLSGYASCAAGTRTLAVLRNDTGVLTSVTLTSGTYCECKVMPSSALFSLVNGTGIRSSLPPI